jgi:hypothetical protein
LSTSVESSAPRTGPTGAGVLPVVAGPDGASWVVDTTPIEQAFHQMQIQLQQLQQGGPSTALPFASRRPPSSQAKRRQQQLPPQQQQQQQPYRSRGPRGGSDGFLDGLFVGPPPLPPQQLPSKKAPPPPPPPPPPPHRAASAATSAF